jgi:hypothetical protein
MHDILPIGISPLDNQVPFPIKLFQFFNWRILPRFIHRFQSQDGGMSFVAIHNPLNHLQLECFGWHGRLLTNEFAKDASHAPNVVPLERQQATAAAATHHNTQNVLGCWRSTGQNRITADFEIYIESRLRIIGYKECFVEVQVEAFNCFNRFRLLLLAL